jgi:Fic family protein
METEKYILCNSEEHFNQLNRKLLYQAYIVGYVNEWGHVVLMKNRFSGQTGTVTQNKYNEIVEMSKSFSEKKC